MLRVSIVIPAYNEEKRISQTLQEYSNYFELLRKSKILDYEILIVINNTTDSTPQIVQQHQKTNPRILYLNLPKGGKGYAVIEGFRSALKRNNELIGFVDADLATSPKAFYDLIKSLNFQGGTIASRYIKGAIVKPKNTLPRIFASRIYNALIRSLMQVPYRDTQCGAKLFSRDAIKSVIDKIGITNWAFDTEILYKIRKQGFKIKEIPTIWADKKYATINFWHSGPFMALSIIRLRILTSPLKRLIRVYDKFIGFIPQ